VTRGVRHWEIADPAKNAEEDYATHERLERLRHATQRMMHAGAIQEQLQTENVLQGSFVRQIIELFSDWPTPRKFVSKTSMSIHRGAE